MKRRVFGTVERLPSKRYRVATSTRAELSLRRGHSPPRPTPAAGRPTPTPTSDVAPGSTHAARNPSTQYAGSWMIRSDLAGSTHVAICLGRAERRCANTWPHAIRWRRDFEGVAPLL